MTGRLVRPCSHPGCGTLVARGRCAKHPYVEAPKRTHPKYQTAYWKGLRDAHLREHPLCAHCFEGGTVTLAQCVDHKDGDRHNDRPTNLQSLCLPCHARKTATEDGGYGNAKGKPKPATGIDGWPVESAQGTRDGLTPTQAQANAPRFA